jgi:uncharacterized membrane protein YhaH (DUF805 family)
MTLKTLASFRGRVPRSTFCALSAAVLVAFLLLVFVVERAGRGATLLLALAAWWLLLALAVKRLHDRGKSPAWLLLALLPLLGPVWLAIELGFLPGTRGENRYGADPLASARDYLEVRF